MNHKLTLRMVFITALLVFFTAYSSAGLAKTCKKQPDAPILKQDVYKDTPYNAGEIAEYKVHYGFIYVGNGVVKVNEPFRYNNNWRQVFDAEGKTGSWYGFIFSGHDRMRVISTKGTSDAQWSFVDQFEHQVGKDPYIKEKTMFYDNNSCVVTTKSKRNRKGKISDKVKKTDFVMGSADALSAAFKIRNSEFKINKTIKFPVYSSRKTWWLEATPVGYETIKTKALGKQRAIKIKLLTFMGSHLQQQGDMYGWIAVDHPSRPLLKATGDLRIGKITLELYKFKAGT